MIVLGRIVAPYGIRGWLKIKPFGDDPDAWRTMQQWWLADQAESDAWQAYSVETFRHHGGSWIVKLAGVDDRGGAEKLDGWYVGAPREAMPETVKDEYYWADLVGLAVMNEQGELLGKVDSLVETGAHQVLLVKGSENGEPRERLLPFVSQVVKEVDVAGGRICVDWQLDW
jgi:16S rRNA processing protein RimM